MNTAFSHLLQIHDLAVKKFGDIQTAAAWLQECQPAFDNLPPLAFLDTPAGTKRVLTALSA